MLLDGQLRPYGGMFILVVRLASYSHFPFLFLASSPRISFPSWRLRVNPSTVDAKALDPMTQIPVITVL